MRRLALELPFYLSQGARDLDLPVDFVGLSAEEYYLNCGGREAILQKRLPRIEPEERPTRDVITGQGEWRGRLVRGDVVDLSFQMRRKEESFAIPLGSFALPIGFADRDLARLAARLLDRLEGEIQTR